MDMFLLAEITSKMDPSGIFCLAAIPCIVIVAIAYCTGPWSGSCTCLFFFVIACFACGDQVGGPPYNVQPNKVMIANLSQSKMMERPGGWALDEGNASMIQRPAKDGIGTEILWVPDKEIMIVDGWKRMKPDGRDIEEDDWYYWNRTIAPINAPRKVGGSGVPQWLYHPAAPLYIFGLAGAPALLGGMFIASKLRG